MSNEHPDMHGNPCDAPIVCDQCGDACNESDLYGSIYDEDKNFCREQCVDDWEEGWESAPSGSDEHNDGLTRSESRLRDMLTIRNYLQERLDLLSEHGHRVNAQAIGDEIILLGKIISKAKAEAKS